MKKIALLISILIAIPVLALASGTLFFEFNPDNSDSLNVVSLGSISEVFIPQNDFLGGFDLWFDNPGLEGTVSLELFNSVGTLLITKNIIVPTLSQVSGGHRIHTDFSQIAVTSNKKYTMKIISDMPELRIYYGSRIGFLGHNAPFTSEYNNGAAVVGGEEKEFSFRFALYESFETSPPVLSNIVTTAISSSETRLDFNANEAVDYKLDYGISGAGYTNRIDLAGSYKYCGAGISFCSIDIPVSPGHDYNYLLTAKDIWGNETQVTGSFSSGESGQTPEPTPTPSLSDQPSPTSTPDTSPLIISNFRISEVTDRSVEVAWTTNKAANSSLLVSFSSYLISITAISDHTLELEHLLKTENVLSHDTTYSVRITSVDSFNNTASATLAFTTLKKPVSTPMPTPSSKPPPGTSQPPGASQSPVSPTSTPANGNHSLSVEGGNNFSTVQWSAPAGGEPADGYRVDIFDKNRNLVKQVTLPKGASSAGVVLPEGEYSAIVYGNDGKVLEKVMKPANFMVSNDTLGKRALTLWPYFVLGLAALVGFVIWELYKKKAAGKIVP